MKCKYPVSLYKRLVSLGSREMKAKSTSRFHHQNDDHKENKSKTKLKQI